LWRINRNAFRNIAGFQCHVIGVEVRDEDPTWPILQVLFLADIEKQMIVDENAGMFDMAWRRDLNISARSKNSQTHVMPPCPARCRLLRSFFDGCALPGLH